MSTPIRSRFKVAVSIPRRVSISRLEQYRIKKIAEGADQSSEEETESPGIKKKIAEGAKQSSAEETESPGLRFLTIKPEEIRKFLQDDFAASGMTYEPPTPLSKEDRDRQREAHRLRVAKIGLSYLNDPANGDAQYELVSPVAARFFISLMPKPHGITHSNFEAKLKNDPDAKAQLFFLEIVEKGPGKHPKVTHCCSLGLSGSKAAATGHNGCRICSKINHPKKRFITH